VSFAGAWAEIGSVVVTGILIFEASSTPRQTPPCSRRGGEVWRRESNAGHDQTVMAIGKLSDPEFAVGVARGALIGGGRISRTSAEGGRTERSGGRRSPRRHGWEMVRDG